MICPFCKEEIAEGALKCKHCESILDGFPQPSPTIAQPQGATTVAATTVPIWTSITSLVLGIMSAVTGLETEWFDEDTALGMLIIAIIALIFGGIALNKKHRGKGMAIAGVVTGGVGILCYLMIEWQ